LKEKVFFEAKKNKDILVIFGFDDKGKKEGPDGHAEEKDRYLINKRLQRSKNI